MIGLGTYAFFWQHSDRTPAPLDLPAMLRRTRDLGVGLFQICDYLPLLDLSAGQLKDLRALADDLDIRLELGTRGITVGHLDRFAKLATTLGATMIRSMINSPDSKPTLTEAEGWLRTAMPRYQDAGITLALETYEQVPTRDLVGLIESVASPQLGICLDPANTVAALENPRDVVERCAPYVANIHVKDFAFTRRGGWVGFTLEGAELGAGLLDYQHMINIVQPKERGISQVIEHWVTWRDDYATTAAVEDTWTSNNLNYLKEQDQ